LSTIKTFILLFHKWLHLFRRPVPAPILCSLFIFISICGCQTCNKNTPPRRSYNCLDQIQHKGNPALIFDMPIFAHRQPTVSAEQFQRSEWPVSRQATGYVNYGEIISYSEYRYDDQSIDSNNKPRQNFHRRLNGYRYGVMAR
jgi:hypothetical protein